MEKTLLYEAFATLGKPERREFGKFVRSPFFNQKAQPVALFEYLCECHDARRAPNGTAAFERIWPGQAYDDQRMRLANSELLGLLEHFWMYQEKFRDFDRAKIRLAAAYRKRNLPKHFQISLREARSARERQPFRHAEFYHDLNLIEWEQYQFATASKRTEHFNLQEMSDLLDAEFAARKLRHVCFSLSHQAVFKTDYRFELLDAVLDYVQSGQRLDIPALALYYHCYRFLTDPADEQHFFIFKEKLLAHAAAFPQDELRILYLFALNFGIKKCNELVQPYFQETLDLYKSALELDLLLENGLLSRFAFNNIVAAALRAGETSWAEDFIHRYRNFVEKKYRDVTYSLNLARVAYTRRDYKTALLHLQRADYKDLINNLIAKTLQLKIFYELGEYDLLESHLASMKTYIRRQAAIGYHRTNYLNIVRYTQQLLQVNLNNTAMIAQLRQQIENEPVLTEREWLLAQSG
ncbi:MAG TPA: hypothetical protein PKL15_15630 [Saprospiraceae bacterium]|nr:hypothetical protein [Saprospiraceae bacterium]HNM26872.1 hypothetical protein [Saprospiraceae bacterium]